MSSFRRVKMEASLRLYSLPRRELQALCKQYRIPTNKTNVAMADALSACVPVDYAKPKAWSGANSLRVSKTTPLKLKLDRTTGLPETSLASFASNSKRKVSPVKLTVADREEASSLKSIATPLQRGLKRSERPLIQTSHEEKTRTTVAPAFTRAAALVDRFGKSAAAASSHNPQAPTPRKRLGKAVETIARRGGDSLPPVFFSGLLSTPKASEPHVPKLISRHQAEPEKESVEVSCTEIEFRNAALHKELFGVRRNVIVQEDQDVTPVAKGTKYRDYASESSVEVGFEFRDMVLYKELFGSHPKINAANSQLGHADSPLHDLQRTGDSPANALRIDLVPLERGIFNSPSTSSTEVLDYSALDVRVLSSIREEDASDDSCNNVEKLEEDTLRHLPHGRDLGPLLDDMPCDSPACSLSRMQEETNLAFEQAQSTVMSPRRYMPLTTNILNSPLVKAATPLTKIRSNIDCTLTKATSILEKLAALRADAEKKRKEGYWEPKFSAVAAHASPAAVFKTALVMDRDLPCAKKARLTPKAMILGPEKGVIVCEDADIVSKGEIPIAKTIRILNESRDLISVVSDKENQSEKSMGNWNSRKLGSLSKEKGKKIEVLKDRSKNMPDHVNNEINQPGFIKSGSEVRPKEMSLRKLRAQFKEKIRHLEMSKASDLWSQRGAWTTSL